MSGGSGQLGSARPQKRQASFGSGSPAVRSSPGAPGRRRTVVPSARQAKTSPPVLRLGAVGVRFRPEGRRSDPAWVGPPVVSSAPGLGVVAAGGSRGKVLVDRTVAVLAGSAALAYAACRSSLRSERTRPRHRGVPARTFSGPRSSNRSGFPPLEVPPKGRGEPPRRMWFGSYATPRTRRLPACEQRRVNSPHVQAGRWGKPART